jgi:hypothetical protein
MMNKQNLVKLLKLYPRIGITLKAHIIEQHIVVYNKKYGISNKEEFFVEQGHQIGMKENRGYHGVANFKKEASLKA